MEDFIHKAFGIAPTIGYIYRREDYDLKSLEIVWLDLADKQHTD